MNAVSRRVLARTFVSELLKASNDRGHLVRALSAFIIEHKQVKALDMIIADIMKELAARGLVAAEVISARELTASTRQTITNLLQAATDAKTIELSESTNPELVGGVHIRLPGRELDSTIKRQLQQLRS